MAKRQKNKPRTPRIFHIEAGYLWNPHLMEPFMGNEPVPLQELELYKTDTRTGHCPQSPMFMIINLN